MNNRLMTNPWPRTAVGHVEFLDTDNALAYAALIWDEKLQITELVSQLLDLRNRYESFKAQPPVDMQILSDLAFAIQFTREALDETYDLQARARNFVRFK